MPLSARFIDSFDRTVHSPAGRKPEKRRLADQAAAEADGDGMRARARLELREKVPDVRLHRLLGEVEPLADLPVHEPVGDELKHFDLPPGRLLLELGAGRLERDDRSRRLAHRAPARGHLLEPTRVVEVAVEDLLAFSCVHEASIGAPAGPL